jgi:hypothetical protein
MRMRKLCILIFSVAFVPLVTFSQEHAETCRSAFNYADEFAVENTIEICMNSSHIPYQYKAEIDMPVCTDTLCANVVIILYWDLAGNYMGFDTIPGKPLTKFDHLEFDAADYLKLDQILKNKNSSLRILNKEDLVDRSVKVKSNVVDAVTGATPKTIKNSVVEGAVYSSFTLWHFVNGAIKNRLASFTQNIYSEQIVRQLLKSENYETQLFALRKLSEKDFENHSDLLFEVIRESAPLIKSYVMVKAPLPFSHIEKNKQFVALYPELDDYSKSIFMNRITTERNIASAFLPLMSTLLADIDKKQLELLTSTYQKFEISGFQELLEKMRKENLPE